MKYLVNIEDRKIGTEINAVNARELHTFIQAKSRFNDWIKNRISKYGFMENQDYITVATSTGGRPSKEYYITFDMAKELAMVENNDKGREARRYFIDIEKKHKLTLSSPNVINGYKSQIVQHNTKIENLKKQLLELQNKHEPTHTHNTFYGCGIMYMHFVEFMYQANKAKDLVYQLSKTQNPTPRMLEATHHDMVRFLNAIAHRYEHIEYTQQFKS